MLLVMSYTLYINCSYKGDENFQASGKNYSTVKGNRNILNFILKRRHLCSVAEMSLSSSFKDAATFFMARSFISKESSLFLHFPMGSHQGTVGPRLAIRGKGGVAWYPSVWLDNVLPSLHILSAAHIWMWDDFASCVSRNFREAHDG